MSNDCFFNLISRRLGKKSILIAAGFLCVAATHASAQLTFGARTNVDDVNFSDLTFANAFVANSTSYDIPAQPQVSSFGFSVSFPAGATNLDVNATGGVTLTNVPVLQPGGNAVTFSTDGSAGTFGWSSHNTAALTLGVSNGLYTLTYLNHSFDTALGTHGFTVETILPGDWAASGTSSGDHEFLGVATGFTITQNFVFDPATDTTTVEATDPNYPSDGSATGLNFVLFGASVPETDWIAPLALAFGVIGIVWARRRITASGT